MKNIEYRTVNKSTWPRGEWDDEPDKVQFQDEATGFPCLIVRNHIGSLCGYVGVSGEHPAFSKDYSDVKSASGDYIDVHGGMTFADQCHPSSEDEQRGICHVPEEGEPEHVWWFGFDCMHAWDRSPAMEASYPRLACDWDCSYKNVQYVKNEIASLAAQLKAIQS